MVRSTEAAPGGAEIPVRSRMSVPAKGGSEAMSVAACDELGAERTGWTFKTPYRYVVPAV